MMLKITDTSYGGYGVGKDESGKVIFVPHAVERDLLDVEIRESSKRFSYAEIKEIINPSCFRIKAKCEYEGVCGGCMFAHINYNKQIEIKNKIVQNALRKYFCDEIKTATSKNEAYRLRATLIAKNGKVGFYKFKSHDFIDISKCVILKESLFEKIKTFAKENKITGSVYAIETKNGVSLANVNDKNGNLRYSDVFDGFVYNKKEHGAMRAGYETINGVIGIGCKTFFQTNSFLIDEFQTAAANLAETDGSIVELYGGSGFFTSALMKKCSDIISSEIDESSVKLAGIYGYNIVKSDAGSFLNNIKHANVIFLDPPREGVSSDVVKNILRIKADKIVYVSCDPMTLARDIGRLSGFYRIKKLLLFDMFPDTYHIETICILTSL